MSPRFSSFLATGCDAPDPGATLGQQPMLTIAELREIALARLEEAELLFRAGRYDGATYLCGYAVEAALKARICRTLHWSGYPSTGAEFRNYQSFRTHDLKVLLHLSSVEARITTTFLNEWSAIADWDPEIRYNPIGTASEQPTRDMIESARVLLRIL